MMNQDKEKNISPPGDDEQLGSTLAKELTTMDTTECPEPEVLATVVENTAPPTVKDHLMKHIASCPDCYDTFMMTAELYNDMETELEDDTDEEVDNIEELPIEPMKRETKEEEKKSWFQRLPKRTMALAASVLIVAFSYYLFYYSDEIAKSPTALFEKAAEPKQDAQRLRPEMEKRLEQQQQEQERKPQRKEEEQKRKIVTDALKEQLPKEAEEMNRQYAPPGKDQAPPQQQVGKSKGKRITPSAKPAPKKRKTEQQLAQSQDFKAAPIQKEYNKKRTRQKTPAKRYAVESATESAVESTPESTAKYKRNQFQQKTEKQDTFSDKEQKREELPKTPIITSNTAQSPSQLWQQIDAQNTIANQSRQYIPANQLTFMFDNALNLTPQLQSELNKNSLQTQQQSIQKFSKLQRATINNSKPFNQRIMPTIKMNPTNTNNLIPNIPWFLSKSRPGSPEQKFFQLASKIYCATPNNCHGKIKPQEAKPLLTQWNQLSPNLTGTLKKIAGYTISRLEQY